jgi:hypothetical protein
MDKKLFLTEASLTKAQNAARLLDGFIAGLNMDSDVPGRVIEEMAALWDVLASEISTTS